MSSAPEIDLPKVETSSVLSRTHNIMRAGIADITESEKRLSTVAAGIGVAVVEAAGIAKLSAVLIPVFSANVLEQTHSPTQAAAAAAGAYGAWVYTAARTLNHGVNEYPNATKAVGDNFPGLVGHTADALPGLRSNELQKLRGRAATRLHRGTAAYVVGTLPYVAAAGATGQTTSERLKLSRNLAIDCGLIVGATSLVLAETVQVVGTENPALANRIQDDMTNPGVWYGLAGLLMVAEWTRNKRRSHKQASIEQTAQKL
jgi:hypothetical protein